MRRLACFLALPTRLAARNARCIGLVALFLSCHAAQAEDGPIQLRIVGGLAGVSQYIKFERPFWTQTVPQLTNGRVQAEVHPFDRSGLPGQEMLQLMRLGVVPYGTALLALVSGDEPELNAVDLPTLNPDFAALRKTVTLYRDYLADLLRSRYGIELLGVYVYPAQVLYCASSFRSFKDLAGRKVRTSSIGQSEMMSAVGAVPALIPFSDIMQAFADHSIDCAITGTMSGAEIGLPTATSYISPMAISWGVSFFGANKSAWDRLPADIRDVLRNGIRSLEQAIWNSAEAETAAGLACDVGSSTCKEGEAFRMNLVPMTREDEVLRRRLLTQSILPKWIQRCGEPCTRAWNANLGGPLQIPLQGEH